MKQILLSLAFFAILGAHGQTKQKQGEKGCDSLRDRLELWIDKVDHMYEWDADQRTFVWKLSHKVDSLQHRLDSLEACCMVRHPNPLTKTRFATAGWLYKISDSTSGPKKKGVKK